VRLFEGDPTTPTSLVTAIHCGTTTQIIRIMTASHLLLHVIIFDNNNDDTA